MQIAEAAEGILRNARELQRGHRLGEAEFQAEQAAALAPGMVEAHACLARIRHLLGRNDSALGAALRALELKPDAETHFLVGLILKDMARTQEAVHHLQKSIHLSSQPCSDAAVFLAALTGGQVTQECVAEYVRKLFDEYADAFDRHLQQSLKYDGPKLMERLLRRHAGGEDGLRILDLGCGTGLCGYVLRPPAEELVGVDISRRMLDRAGERGVYDRLEQAEMHEFLQARSGCFDRIVAADVLIYAGDLNRLFRAARHALRGTGLFVFTVEKCTGTSFELKPDGRFSHSDIYIRETARSAGFEVLELFERSIRCEQGSNVPGTAVVLRAI